MSTRARWLARRGLVGAALVAAIGLLIGFHSVVSDAVARADARRASIAVHAGADPAPEQRLLLARRGE